MLEAQIAVESEPVAATAASVVDVVRTIATRELPALVQKIDAEGYYPETVMRTLGRAGAYAQHLPGEAEIKVDLGTAIDAMAAVGEHCLSTSFCMWCQDALGWYIYSSDNDGIEGESRPARRAR